MSSLFFRVFQHLLPRARALSITLNKPLRDLFIGLSDYGAEFKSFVDAIYNDKFPLITRELDAWEVQLTPPESPITTQERRDRLARIWARRGAQDPRSIANVITAEGFSVSLSEWWVNGSEPPVGTIGCATAIDPSTAGAGAYCISSKTAITGGINDIISRAGIPQMRAGDPIAQAGKLSGAGESFAPCTIPTDPACWPYIIYVHGATFGAPAIIPAERKNEFENLLVKLKPGQQWLVITATYI